MHVKVVASVPAAVHVAALATSHTVQSEVATKNPGAQWAWVLSVATLVTSSFLHTIVPVVHSKHAVPPAFGTQKGIHAGTPVRALFRHIALATVQSTHDKPSAATIFCPGHDVTTVKLLHVVKPAIHFVHYFYRVPLLAS